jgi:hypothetical protein
MQGRGKSQRGSIGGHIMNAAIGDQDGARDAIRRHIGERRRQRGEQLGAIGFAVGGAGFGDADLESRNALEPFDEGGARSLCLLGAIAEILARALVDDDGGYRRYRIAVFASERGICERKHHQAQRERAQRRAAASRDEEHQGNQNGRGKCSPHRVSGHQRSK